jgi:predicted RNase H-like HicB family nuclease
MSITVKSKKSAKGSKSGPAHLLGPAHLPGPAHLARAAELAERYKVTVWIEEGEWYGKCVELPHCMGDGASADAAIASTRQAIRAGLAADLADGLPVPLPARDGVRSQQVNIRLSADERAAIEANAARMGFKGMADYIRARALQ